MNINWKVRVKNKTFWLALIPALFVLAQYILPLFGIDFDFVGWQDWAMNVVNAVFAILAILGIVADPTTDGVSDSKQAMRYEKPKKDE